MKSVDNELQIIKNDYGDKISAPLRQKIDRYLLLFKEIGKLDIHKNKPNPASNMLQNFNRELVVLRREIQAQIKNNLTDYEAFLWKLQTLEKQTKPLFFTHLEIGKTRKDYSIHEAKINMNFPILEYKTKDLIMLCTQLLLQNSFCKENFDHKFIFKLVKTISQKYNINSYHHFSHAFSVFLLSFQCIQLSPSFKSLFTSFQLFITFIAALCHDMNHTGTNSFYEIKRKTELSVLYNNESVLENMHIAQFYRMNKEHSDIDIIEKIKSPAQKVSAKMFFNQLILATDISNHKPNLDKMISLRNKNMKQFTNNQKSIIMENHFHACDIGNPTLEFKNYMNWSILLTYEFNNQANLEKTHGLEITPNFTFKDIKTHYKGQIGFINFLAFPVWKEIGNFFPDLQFLSEQMTKNKEKLEKLEKND